MNEQEKPLIWHALVCRRCGATDKVLLESGDEPNRKWWCAECMHKLYAEARSHYLARQAEKEKP